MTRTLAVATALSAWLFASHASAQADLCSSLGSTARTIVGGLQTIPAAQVMMDGTPVPPLLIPGTTSPFVFEDRRGEQVSYSAYVFNGMNATGAAERAGRIYEEWVKRVTACHLGYKPLVQQDSNLEERIIFSGKPWQVTVSRGGGGTASGFSYVRIEVSLRKGARLD